jgi:hypothetical protein
MWERTEMHKNLVGKPEERNLLENHDVDGDNININLKNHEVRIRNK